MKFQNDLGQEGARTDILRKHSFLARECERRHKALGEAKRNPGLYAVARIRELRTVRESQSSTGSRRDRVLHSLDPSSTQSRFSMTAYFRSPICCMIAKLSIKFQVSMIKPSSSK